MGLGYNVTVSRIAADDLTRCDPDGERIAARVLAGELTVGSSIHSEGFSWVEWLRRAPTIVISQSGGYPDLFLVRARDCPAAAAIPPDEWLHVELWDES